jgi:8-oxo-dGTP pyrophosphatase MutT (NUDIX family)
MTHFKLPDDGLPVRERTVVRVVVIDSLDRVLLFHTQDVVRPEVGTWWELPGGGAEPNESYVDTAIRELHEETGILADPSQLGAPTWRRTASFKSRTTRNLNHETILTVRLPAAGPPVDESHRLDYELEDYFDYRWWPIPEILTSTARFYPGRLPELLPALLSGTPVDEPFELWN